MNVDRGGGAAVLGAMEAVGALDLPLDVVAVVPATENLPGGDAFKPGDVLTMANGKTVEILTTDAEGRLILADALLYARRFAPAAGVAPAPPPRPGGAAPAPTPSSTPAASSPRRSWTAPP